MAVIGASDTEIEAGSPANVMATAFWADHKRILPPGWQPAQVTGPQAPLSELGQGRPDSLWVQL